MREFWLGLGHVMAYFISAAAAAFLCRAFLPIPTEIFRKTLHMILLGSLPFFTFGFENWWVSAAAAVFIAVSVYPVLKFFERFRSYSSFTTERRSGELKSSLLLVFGMFAAVIAVCWGWLGDRWLVVASIYAWGFGDAAAALVGKRFGRHKLAWKRLDGKKSLEGSAAMFAVSFASVAAVLSLRGGLALPALLAASLAAAAVSTLVELYTSGGYDTVTCPLAAMAVLLPLLKLMGGI